MLESKTDCALLLANAALNGLSALRSCLLAGGLYACHFVTARESTMFCSSHWESWHDWLSTSAMASPASAL
jgi:hypothetical protein